MDGHGGPWISKELAEPVEAAGAAEDRGAPRSAAEDAEVTIVSSVSQFSQLVISHFLKPASCLEAR